MAPSATLVSSSRNKPIRSSFLRYISAASDTTLHQPRASDSVELSIFIAPSTAQERTAGKAPSGSKIYSFKSGSAVSGTYVNGIGRIRRHIASSLMIGRWLVEIHSFA